MEHAAVFGLSKEALMAMVTGVCAAVALALFVRDILYGGSRPYIWAWLVRAGLCVVAFLSQLAGGATYSLALSGAQVASVAIIIALILRRRPQLGRLDSTDRFAVLLAGGGVAVWLVSGNPLFGLLGALFADGVATAIGIRANVYKGTEESLPFWTCWLVAGSATLFATGGASLVVVAAPIFSILNAAANIGAVLWVRRRNQAQRAPATEAAT